MSKQQTTLEIPSAVLIPAPPIDLDLAATRLRRAATVLLVLTLSFGFNMLGFLSGLVASLSVLLVASAEIPKRAKCIKLCALLAAAVAFVEALSMAVALAAGAPEHFSHSLEAHCVRVPPSTFAWAEHTLRASHPYADAPAALPPPQFSECERTAAGAMVPHASERQEHFCHVAADAAARWAKCLLALGTFLKLFVVSSALSLAKRTRAIEPPPVA